MAGLYGRHGREADATKCHTRLSAAQADCYGAGMNNDESRALKRLDQLSRVTKAEAERREWAKRQAGTTGAANEGRSIKMWLCSCGWTGGVRDLKVVDGKPTCPSCRRADELHTA